MLEPGRAQSPAQRRAELRGACRVAAGPRPLAGAASASGAGPGPLGSAAQRGVRAELAAAPGVRRAGAGAAQAPEPRARAGRSAGGRGRPRTLDPGPGTPPLRAAPPSHPGGPGWSRERGARGPSSASQARGGEAPSPPAAEGAPKPTSVTSPAPPPPPLPSRARLPPPSGRIQFPGARARSRRRCALRGAGSRPRCRRRAPHLLPRPWRGAAWAGGSGALEAPETPSRLVARCHLGNWTAGPGRGHPSPRR